MTHTYQVSGMTCSSCEGTVKSKLLTLLAVQTADVSRVNNTVTITMNKHIPVKELQQSLGGETSRYQISALHNETVEQAAGWFITYKPILLLFGFIAIVTLSIQLSSHHFTLMTWMQHFMAGFFLCFAFFKMLDLRAFADSYSMYDIIAKELKIWGYVYAFIEVGLGIAFITNWNPLATNLITAIVMAVSMIGVLQSVMNKRNIQCACLGTVFNLPMSTVTIVEDGLMIVMSIAMLFLI